MTHASPRAPARRAHLFLSSALLLVLALCAMALTMWAAAAPARADALNVEPGLVDARLEWSPLRPQAVRAVAEDVRVLGAGWVRLNVIWNQVEPRRGHYNAAELAELDQLVDAVHGEGAKVLLTVYWAPRWATDSRWWRRPPPGVSSGYHAYDALRASALPRLERLAAMLARRYATRIAGMECWNEPNSWAFLYPQRTRSDPDFGPRTYLRMLRAFSAGVRGTGTGIPVIGGATMSFGTNDVYRTSPQRFAGYLAAHGAAALIDGYSHHPYVPGGSRHLAPSSKPDRPRFTVTLGNLPTLLRLFPGKPFYLTEFGYNTRPSLDFGGQYVSERTQARYLAKAYRVAARYPQVKALFWYLAVDVRPRGLPADRGVYTGLRRPNGSQKPSWDAFQAL